MNRGIVVGKIYNKDGTPAGNAKVKIHHVSGAKRNLAIEKLEGKVNSRGEHAARFLWKGLAWSEEEMSGSLTIRIVAWTEVGDLLRDGYSKDTSFVTRTIPGYLVPDVLHSFNVASRNPFSGFKDLGDL